MIGARKQGAVVRSFLALALPEAVREACARLVGELRARPGGEGVRWVRPEAYHLTLRFLGNVAVDSLPDLSKCVGEAVAGSAAFEASLGELLAFPDRRRPRVVALAAHPAPALAALAERVEEGVVAAGLPAATRRFSAHLTLGRVRNRRLPSFEGVQAPEPGRFPADPVVLFQSDLAPEGAHYTALERFFVSP